MEDEVWTTKDGRQIPVGELEVDHLRNILRLIIRKRRQQRELEAQLEALPEPELTVGQMQDVLDGEAMRALRDPNCYFPLLEGGVYGSEELYQKYGRRS